MIIYGRPVGFTQLATDILVSASSHTGEGYGSPFQSSRLENPMDGGAW